MDSEVEVGVRVRVEFRIVNKLKLILVWNSEGVKYFYLFI